MRAHGKRARLGGALVAAAAALALVAVPGLASGHRNHDDPPAGTVQSFDPESGVLTIGLADGGEVSGLVTRRTHVRCDNGRHLGRHGLRHRKRGHGASASHRRGGKDEPGEDHGGRHSHGVDDDSRHCGTDDLTAGAAVKSAILVLVDGQAIYKTVALPKSDDDGDDSGTPSE